MGCPLFRRKVPPSLWDTVPPKRVRVFLPQGAITVNLLKPNTRFLAQGFSDLH